MLKKLLTVGIFPLIFLLIFARYTPVLSYTEEDGGLDQHKVIRVGFPIQGGLCMKDENGNYSGYTYEYLQEIAQYTGWEYEFVELEGSTNEILLGMMEMLDKGEIDILGGMVKNSYTQTRFDLPEYGYGFSYTTLLVPEDNTNISESNYFTHKKLIIASYKNADNTNSKLDSFCKTNNIQYELLECNTEVECYEATISGKADLMLGNDLTPLEGMRVVGKFDGSSFYFATTKGNQSIVNELNSSMLTINQVKSNFGTSLYEKYFTQHNNELYITATEQSYIQQIAPLRVMFVKDIQPIQYVDDEGELSGIAVAVLNHISQSTGLAFEYTILDSFAQASELLKKGEGDIISGIPYDYRLAQQNELYLSNCFLTSQMAILTRLHSTEKEDILVGAVDRLSINSEEDSSHLYPTVVACADALKRDEIDQAVMNLYSAEYAIQNLDLGEFRMIPQNATEIDFCFGISRSTNTILISIFNKALRNISPAELEAIIYQNAMESSRAVTLSGLIKANPLLFIWALLAFFMVVILIGMTILRLRMEANKRLNIENQRYLLLSALANEYIYEYDCEVDRINLSKEFAELFSLPLYIHSVKKMKDGSVKLYEHLNPYIFELFHELISPSDDVSDGQLLCRLPSGEERWYRNTKAEVTDQKSGKTIYVIGKLSDIQKEKTEKEQLEQQLALDGLTNIYNVVATKEIISQRLEKMHHSSAFMIMDIDCFKSVNDTLGHYIGDQVLREFASLLKGVAGSWDVAGRLGGDEFLLFIDHAPSLEHTTQLCHRICEKARKQYGNEEGKTHEISISIGAVFVEKSVTFDHLYQAADKALYQSKDRGRNCVTLVGQSALEEEIEKAPSSK